MSSRGAAAQLAPTAPLNGVWTLNRAASDFPKEIGFILEYPADPNDAQSATPARGRRGGGGGGSRASSSPLSGRRESYEDGQRKQLLTGEARNPPARLMLVDSGAAVTITNELGQSRTLRLSGRTESVEVQGIVFLVTSQRDGDRVVATFQVEQDRQVRYTYSPSGVHGSSRSRWNSSTAERPATRRRASTTSAPRAQTWRRIAPRRRRRRRQAQRLRQPTSRAKTFDQRPGAEFRGLKDVGVLVEDPGSEAQACRLKHDALEDALARRLTAGGLNVRRNSDEDTYLYVNIITTAMPNGSCVRGRRVPLHARDREGDLSPATSVGAGVAAAPWRHRRKRGRVHAAAVSRGLEGYVDLFVTQIRDANK